MDEGVGSGKALLTRALELKLQCGPPPPMNCQAAWSDGGGGMVPSPGRGWFHRWSLLWTLSTEPCIFSILVLIDTREEEREH